MPEAVPQQDRLLGVNQQLHLDEHNHRMSEEGNGSGRCD